jgi:hypothetical protein
MPVFTKQNQAIAGLDDILRPRNYLELTLRTIFTVDGDELDPEPVPQSEFL